VALDGISYRAYEIFHESASKKMEQSKARAVYAPSTASSTRKSTSFAIVPAPAGYVQPSTPWIGSWES
jgi:hypothetical protein